MSFANAVQLTSHSTESKILGFSKISRVPNENEIPGISSSSSSPSIVSNSKSNPENTGDYKKSIEFNKYAVDAKSQKTAKIIKKINSNMNRHFIKVDAVKFPSTNAIKSSWISKINANNHKPEVLGIPFYDPDYDHALEIEDQLNCLIEQATSSYPSSSAYITSEVSSSNEPINGGSQIFSYKENLIDALPENNTMYPNLSKASIEGRLASSLTEQLKRLNDIQNQRKQLLTRQVYKLEDETSVDQNKENFNADISTDGFVDASSNSRFAKLMSLGLDRSLLLNQAQGIYSTFLNDMIALNRNRAHQSKSAEELAMHQVPLTFLETQL